jgi:c(7)-type cytochrome triheme protein
MFDEKQGRHTHWATRFDDGCGRFAIRGSIDQSSPGSREGRRGISWGFLRNDQLAVTVEPEEECPMSYCCRIVTLAGLFAVVLLFSSSPGFTQEGPADFKFEGAKDSPGPVTFSHAQHLQKVKKCSACHTQVFKMKKGQTGPLAMEKMKAGEQCGACHNGKTEVAGKTVFTVDDPANCEKCHRK